MSGSSIPPRPDLRGAELRSGASGASRPWAVIVIASSALLAVILVVVTGLSIADPGGRATASPGLRSSQPPPISSPSAPDQPTVDRSDPPFRLRGARYEPRPSSAWRRWTASDGSFTVNAPGPGDLVPGQRLPMWEVPFNAAHGTLLLMVESVSWRYQASELAKQQLSSWSEGLDEGRPGPFRKVRAGDARGWQTKVPNDAGGYQWVLRVCVNDGRIYYLMASFDPADREATREAEHFFDSFRSPALVRGPPLVGGGP